MTIEEAEHLICAEFHEWQGKYGTGDFNLDMPSFHCWLSGEKRGLLKFKCRGDKRQRVKDWIQDSLRHAA